MGLWEVMESRLVIAEANVKAQLVVTDSSGQSFEGVVDLLPSHVGRTKRQEKGSSVRVSLASPAQKVNFDLPMRNFMKTYGHARSGPAKFALVVAYLAGGDTGKAVAGEDVKKQWNSMTALLGDFNLAYPTRAKDQGWVDSKQRGSYTLSSAWVQALGSNG
jgi:hypothetical protein